MSHANAAKELALQSEVTFSESQFFVCLSNVQELERGGHSKEAAQAHQEAARLYRLASVSAQDNRDQQQMRMLARHHGVCCLDVDCMSFMCI
jgi:hypothetical protein